MTRAEHILDACRHERVCADCGVNDIPCGPCRVCALRAVQVAREQEREACAKVAVDTANMSRMFNDPHAAACRRESLSIAAAIRARGAR